jgi:ferredoxin
MNEMFKVKIMEIEETFLVNDGTSLTELDDIIPFGCRSGACGACVIKILSERSNFGFVEECERDFLLGLGFNVEEHRLACQCKVKGDLEFEVIGS